MRATFRVSAGKFDVEDYTLYLVEFMRALGPDTHVIAVCQPAPLTLAATAYLAAEDPDAQPRSLTLIGGPVDPDAAATEVTDFGRRVTMGQLEHLAIQRVGFKYKGAGRLVYPGLLQLQSFMSMNAERHGKAFSEQIMRVARGEASDHDAHNRFYDEYLAVMDMTAEFYLSTVERIFKNREIATNEFVVAGKQGGYRCDHQGGGDDGRRVANDDISAPGQCVAALNLLTGLPDDKKAQHLEPGAGHYGIFAGKSWRLNIRPLVLNFIDANAGAAKPQGEDPTGGAVAPGVADVAWLFENSRGSAQQHRPGEESLAGPSVTASGCSSCGRWPASAITSSSHTASSRPETPAAAAGHQRIGLAGKDQRRALDLAQGLLLIRAALQRAQAGAGTWPRPPALPPCPAPTPCTSSRHGASCRAAAGASAHMPRPGARSWPRPAAPRGRRPACGGSGSGSVAIRAMRLTASGQRRRISIATLPPRPWPSSAKRGGRCGAIAAAIFSTVSPSPARSAGSPAGRPQMHDLRHEAARIGHEAGDQHQRLGADVARAVVRNTGWQRCCNRHDLRRLAHKPLRFKADFRSNLPGRAAEATSADVRLRARLAASSGAAWRRAARTVLDRLGDQRKTGGRGKPVVGVLDQRQPEIRAGDMVQQAQRNRAAAHRYRRCLAKDATGNGRCRGRSITRFALPVFNQAAGDRIGFVGIVRWAQQHARSASSFGALGQR